MWGVTRVARIVALLVALAFGCAAANAQAPYPSKPIRVVIPFGPGGFADITMRLVGQKLALVDDTPGVTRDRRVESRG